MQNRGHVIEHAIFVVCQTSVPYFFSLTLSLSLSLLLAFHLDYFVIDREEALPVLDKRAGPGKRLVGIE